jgi:L-ribulose-5-phosphate 3-epimerase UlaE
MIRKSARSVKKPEFFNFKEQLSSSKSVRFSNVELSDTEDDDEEGDNDDKEDEITTNNKVIIKTSVSNVKRKSTQFIPAAGSFMGMWR